MKKLGILLTFLGLMLATTVAFADNKPTIPMKPVVTPASTPVELFGHVTLVEGYDLPSYKGCHALVALRDKPGVIVAVMTTEPRLQSLLETALATGNLIAFWGVKFSTPPTPRGGTWSVDVYNIDGVILYNMK